MAEETNVNGLRFKDKVAVVTGGCCGIGRGCADVFAQHGGKIAVLDVNDKVCQEFSSQHVADPGLKFIDELTVEGFKDLLKLNLVSYFTAKKYSLPHLRKVKGTIVNITSIGASAAAAGAVTYCASKGGTVSLTKALAIDEAKMAISPSIVDTPLLRAVLKANGGGDNATKTLESYLLLRRIGQPREIEMAALFLAVDATFTTGEELMCTGGSDIGYGIKE